jgi:hypothetical protein
VNFFGSMNWIGIGAVYPGIEPEVKPEAVNDSSSCDVFVLVRNNAHVSLTRSRSISQLAMTAS